MPCLKCQYPLSMRPGESRTIQLTNPDRSPYVIPDGSTVKAIAVDIMGQVIANLAATILDASMGKIRVTLPDSVVVRSHQGIASWDLQMILPDGGKEFLPQSTLEILYSASLLASSPG